MLFIVTSPEIITPEIVERRIYLLGGVNSSFKGKKNPELEISMET